MLLVSLCLKVITFGGFHYKYLKIMFVGRSNFFIYLELKGAHNLHMGEICTVYFVLRSYYFSFHFQGCSSLPNLQATLENQSLYVELLQELSPGHNVNLATFETSALEFLFPYPQLRPTYTSGVDVDLLMEPTRDFPGIISPKVNNYLLISKWSKSISSHEQS